jgi:hypothetical protein
MKVINLWAGPGAGKSTTAAGLFFLMKLTGRRVELVTEYAKEVVYDQDPTRIKNQLLILAKQDERLRRLQGQVDYVITDSPLPATWVYAKPPFQDPWFHKTVNAVFRTYDNFNILVSRLSISLQ